MKISIKKLRSIILILLISLSTKSDADYTPYSLSELIVKADIIAYGTIINLNNETITFKIDKSLTGEKGNLQIHQFKEWECAARWTKYEIGQHLFLFLKKKGENIFALGSGNEGELPIVNSSVYFGDFFSYSKLLNNTDGIIKRDRKTYMRKGVMLYGNLYRNCIEWDLKDFTSSISLFRNCISYVDDPKKYLITWDTKCDYDKIRDLANSNALFYYLCGIW
ncbi:hypothetical protein Pedsa_1158 [Pseudopedobacter saltans DSM 12145]|uniref:Uncharacterized protein n=1 Tax=Pseudopedobacter saltans (strain ATCC 51119 / DSM 12145 / JCM 21818 / CCUG 39354 / LMG 10337 / NBRC 100064 / NCIMB 13643) TaxID=762903 RepID=F0SCD0_PSESL|nr:hypothetical protein [Pseudopedobacter saltans]ADY51727.1 hypothetical protein Pedsa_1158 [Pseudopedobacter saltans DSM 12145]